jgi:protein disulfide-isomerase A1
MIKALFVSLLCVGIVGASIPTEDGVLVLGDDNFDEAIASGDMLVEFYAPWCGHCKKLEPEYKKAAAALVDESAKLAKVDATIATGLAERFEIKGFPTLKYFKGGRAVDYNGGRTASEISSWVKKQSGPPAKTVTSAEEVQSLQEANDVVVVGVFSDLTSAAAKSFLSIAASDEALSFAISSSQAVKDHFNVNADTVVLLKSFDDKRNDLDVSTFDKTTVEEFLNAESSPLVQTFSQETSKKIFSSKITVSISYYFMFSCHY